MRSRARRIVGERFLQVFDRLILAAAEQPWHLQIPSPQRTVSGALLKIRVEHQHGLQCFLHRTAVLDALAQSERLGHGAHVGCHPEVTLRLIGLEHGRLTTGFDTALVLRATSVLGHVSAQPVARPREFPRRLEILWVALEAGFPDRG